jgi:CheY-like chemotaxis protein
VLVPKTAFGRRGVPQAIVEAEICFGGDTMARANILVVEDSFTVAKRLRISLERLGFCVDVARNGREAWTKAKRQQYDLVVTDEQMPVMSGQELCRQLRNDDRYAHTPIVFLTAHAPDLDTNEVNGDLGVSAIFEKPFRPELIIRFIENQLRDARRNKAGENAGSASA